MTVLLAAVALAAAAPAPAAATAINAVPYVMPRTLVTSVRAGDGTPYRLFVAWPEGDAPAAGWPVLVVLDGADNFAVMAETARRLARGGRSGIASGLVVGIDSGSLARRVLDYTPSVPGYAIPAGLPAAGLATGGADAFLDAVAQTILPWVTARWRIDPRRRTLAGHSFGGLLALHAAATRPALFARHAAISPSLWFGNKAARAEAATLGRGTHMLLAAGTAEAGPNVGAPDELAAIAETVHRRGGTVETIALAGQSHGTTMLAATPAILTLAFGQAR